MTHALHYQPAEHAAGPGHAIRNLAIVLVVMNALIAGVGAWDRSWGALGMVLVYGPIANGLTLIIGLALTPLLRRWHPAARMGPYVASAIFFPMLAYGVDVAVIFGAMEIFGSEGC